MYCSFLDWFRVLRLSTGDGIVPDWRGIWYSRTGWITWSVVEGCSLLMKLCVSSSIACTDPDAVCNVKPPPYSNNGCWPNGNRVSPMYTTRPPAHISTTLIYANLCSLISSMNKRQSSLTNVHHKTTCSHINYANLCKFMQSNKFNKQTAIKSHQCTPHDRLLAYQLC